MHIVIKGINIIKINIKINKNECSCKKDLKLSENIAIAVKSLETAIPYYENVLGLKCYNIEE